MLKIAKKSSKKSPSPSRSLGSPTIIKRSDVSPLRNIEVPPSNLQPVKEETELSSSQSDTSTTNKMKKLSTPTPSMDEVCWFNFNK